MLQRSINEGRADYTLTELREWKNWIVCQRKQLDREEVFVDQCMAGCLLFKEEVLEEKRKKRKRKEKDSEEGESDSEESAEEAAKQNQIIIRQKKVLLKKRKKAAKESEEAAEGYAEEGADSEWYHEGEIEDEWWYAWQWVQQYGDDFGIPKQYTPCAYFFKNHRCKFEEKCEFSHNQEIFLKEPFAACLVNLSWE